MEDYKLEKSVWTDSDFDKMGWHDNKIYQIRLNSGELELDIDYILKWNEPALQGMPFTFWIAPATLIFKNVTDITFDLNTIYDDVFEIDFIEREMVGNGNKFVIGTQRGELCFKSCGYAQYIRQKPSFQFDQTIGYVDRYGISLERTTEQENPNIATEDYKHRKEKDLADYEIAKKRQLHKLELENLYQLRERNEIDLKQFLIRKKELNDMTIYYEYELRNTLFEHWGK